MGLVADLNNYYAGVMRERQLRNARHPIIDVGSGARPLDEADVFCDLSVETNPHRVDSKAKIPAGKSFLICDLNHLPFKDSAFAFANCSHVLEHMDRPRTALAELERISGAGYVETPGWLGELVLFGNPSHLWVVSHRGNVLLMRSTRRLTVRGKTLIPMGYLFAPLFRRAWIFKVLVSALDFAFPGLLIVRFTYNKSKH